jgi:elongation factor G
MKEYKPENIRNVGIVGHGKSGKTSLAEAMLFTSGASDRLGKVGDNSCIMDFDPDEIKRGVSINVSLAFCEWKGKKVNVLDTPGFANFIAETEACMRVMDSAIVVLNAESGVEVVTEKVWKWSDDKNLPRLVFVNRLDHEQADPIRCFDSIAHKFKQTPVSFQLPIGKGSDFKGVVDLLAMKAVYFSNDTGGKTEIKKIPDDLKKTAEEHREKIVECAAETDDALTEKYLEGATLTEDEIFYGLKAGISSGSIVPILYGSAIKNQGVSLLLDCLLQYFPSPLDAPEAMGKNLKSGEEFFLKTSEDGNLAALVFKTIADPFAGKLSLFRVYSGILKGDQNIFNPQKKSQEHVGHVFYLQGKKQIPVPRILAGDLGCTAKLKSTATGDTLCQDKNGVVFEKITFPEPALSMAIIPKSREDEEKVSTSLHRLIEEDPSLQVGRDPQTHEMIISGMGVVHLEVVVERLKRKFGVEVEVRTPQIPYKETIRTSTKIQGKYKKQSGGRGQYGDTWLEICPLQRGEGFIFEDKIVGGAIPKHYIPAVEKGITEAMQEGIFAGYPMVDLKVVLYDGSYHEVDSSEMAFKIAGSIGFKKGAMDCKPVLLEPIKDMEITVPTENVGDIMGDINSRRGKVSGIEPSGVYQIIKAKVPMAEILKYAPDLRSMTGGRGSFHSSFSHFEEVPGHLAEKITAERKKE